MQKIAADVLSIFSLYCGYTTAEWSARWWRWLLSIPRRENPAFDSTGRNCGISQQYPKVFFLCQTVGNSKSPVFRKAIVPRNKTLFLPIINWISISGVDGETDEEINSVAKKKIDAVSDLELKVNGERIKNLHDYRIRSPFFDIILPENNVLYEPPGSRRCVSDGYWIFLKPLQKKITLSSFGACSSGINRIGIVYELVVS
jgi:hypothetical protein